MYMDQVYQIRAIMESTGATKDAPVIRVLLDEALGARRRKALGISESEEPLGQGTALNTLQVLLLRLIKREEMVFRRQTVTFGVLRETLIEARAGREVYFEDIVERPWLEKGKTRETMKNYFDMKTRNTTDYVDQVIDKIKKEEANKS